MANLRDIKRRIVSVKNTRQITKAMKLVSGAKLKRAQDRATEARPYADSIARVLARVASGAGDDVSHPLLTSHKRVDTVLIVVVGSDKGLCGSFNSGLFRTMDKELLARFADKKILVRTYGKKARSHYSSRQEVTDSVIDLGADKYAGIAQSLAEDLTVGFQAGDFQEVWLAYNHFVSVMTQEPTLAPVLPLSVKNDDPGDNVDYEYEPDGQQLLNTLLPLQLQTHLMQAFYDSEAGEHAARMKAMDSATRNASDLVDSLTLQYNRARQAAITTEIIEIVSGAEAL